MNTPKSVGNGATHPTPAPRLINLSSVKGTFTSALPTIVTLSSTSAPPATKQVTDFRSVKAAVVKKTTATATTPSSLASNNSSKGGLVVLGHGHDLPLNGEEAEEDEEEEEEEYEQYYDEEEDSEKIRIKPNAAALKRIMTGVEGHNKRVLAPTVERAQEAARTDQSLDRLVTLNGAKEILRIAKTYSIQVRFSDTALYSQAVKALREEEDGGGEGGSAAEPSTTKKTVIVKKKPLIVKKRPAPDPETARLAANKIVGNAFAGLGLLKGKGAAAGGGRQGGGGGGAAAAAAAATKMSLPSSSSAAPGTVFKGKEGEDGEGNAKEVEEEASIVVVNNNTNNGNRGGEGGGGKGASNKKKRKLSESFMAGAQQGEEDNVEGEDGDDDEGEGDGDGSAAPSIMMTTSGKGDKRIKRGALAGRVGGREGGSGGARGRAAKRGRGGGAGGGGGAAGGGRGFKQALLGIVGGGGRGGGSGFLHGGGVKKNKK